MKLSRPLALVSAIALVVGSSLAISGAASAATPGVTYVTVADITVSAVPADGPAGWSVYSATATSGLTGLDTTLGAHLRNTFATPLAASATVLETIAASSAFTSNNPGDVYPEFDLVPAPAAAWQIIFADLPGPAGLTNPAATFQCNFAVGAIPANTSSTLAQFDAQLATLPGATIAGIEFFDGTPSVYSSVKVNGAQYIFTPNPVFTAPTTIAVGDFTTSPGVTVTTNGFLPGESVDVVYDTPGGSSTIATINADAAGSVTFSHFDPTATVGAYRLRFFGSVPNGQIFAFSVTAAVLAATGVPAAGPLMFGVGTLLTGLVLGAIALRWRSRVS
ncbi:MAG TPA: hypothetical protein VGM70_10865 [Pseudolysinimonas sp.]|jgi:hypothetical protein